MCSAMAIQGAPALRRGALEVQNGFVPGRQLAQNTIGLASAAHQFGRSERAADFPILTSWDYAAAFPSVIQAWIHIVFAGTGAPLGFRLFVIAIYTSVTAVGRASEGTIFLY